MSASKVASKAASSACKHTHKHTHKHAYDWENESPKTENAEVLMHIKHMYMCCMPRLPVDYLPNRIAR